VGYWESVDELRENWQIDRSFEPQETDDVERRHGQWKEAVDRARDWAKEG
jgi:glycerol kinase